jgi:MFS family permease
MQTTRTTRPGTALAVLCTAQFVDVMGVTVVVVALPTMRGDLQASPAQVQLVVSAYAFLFGCLLLAGGRAGDRWGRLRLFRGGLVAFGGASLLCGLAPTAEVLVAGRAAQGAAAAAVVPAALALVTATFTGDAERRRALAVWTAAGAGGGALGLFAGGLVTDLVGWRWIFLANLPLVLFSVALAGRSLPPDAPESGAAGGSLVPRAVLTPLLLVACGVAFVNTATTSSAGTLATLHAQDVVGLSPLGAGLLLLPFSLSVVLGSAIGASLLGRLGPPSAAVGLTTIGAGILCCVAATTVSEGAAVVLIGAGVTVSGTGLGVAAVASTATGTSAAPPEHLGVASGLINTATQLGTAVGTASLLGLADAVSGSGGGPDALATGYRAGFAAAAALALVAAVATAVVLRRQGEDVTQVAVTTGPGAPSGG